MPVELTLRCSGKADAKNAKEEFVKPTVVVLLPFIRRILGRLRVFWVILLASMLLSGCVNYDVGVNFESQHQGQIVQHIKLGEQLTNFSNTQAQEWLRSIERRAKQLQGTTKRLANEEIIVTIPFQSGTELESKFNQFFNPAVKKSKPTKTTETVDLPNFNSKFHLNQGNFILWQRNHLSYDLDLRSLGVLSSKGNVVVTPSSLLDLQFSLETPWGARSIEESANAIRPNVYDDGHQLVWMLKPGQINHLEAVFWLPSPLGIGTFVIVLFVLGGFYIKYKSFPWVVTKPAMPTTVSKVR
jgi:hypothetical protein